MQDIAKALTAFRSSCPPVIFDKENPHFHSKFASLKRILKTIGPALKESGLSVIQFPESQNVDGRVCVGCRTIVLHESGERIEHSFVLPAAKQDPQAGMAALTYARRGSLGSVLGLVIEEDGEVEAALGYGELANAGKREPRKTTAPAMKKPNREKLKFAARERIKELGDESIGEGEVLDAVAKGLGYSSKIEMKDSDYGRALSATQEFEPGEAAA